MTILHRLILDKWGTFGNCSAQTGVHNEAIKRLTTSGAGHIHSLQKILTQLGRKDLLIIFEDEDKHPEFFETTKEGDS